jgi:uncharacterized cofD-like protein
VRIVALGGGTGLSTVLRGLKNHIARRKEDQVRMPISDLAAVVTVTDDGGSSGRLRRDFRILPPGDIRNCMVALSKDELLLGNLFQFRFPAGHGLRGHSFGNLFLTALSSITGDFIEAVRLTGQVLAIRGRIFPSTTQIVTLEAEMKDGRHVAGETRIAKEGKRAGIRRIRLVPRRVRPMPEVLEAIRQADLILVGPGSLYTSIIPNLLISGVAQAIRRSKATRVYICNLMTQPGETPGYSASDHVRAIYRHAGPRLFDWIVVNHAPISKRLLRRYRAEHSAPVLADLAELRKMGLRCILDNLLEDDGPPQHRRTGVARHNAERLTRLVLEEFVERRPRR